MNRREMITTTALGAAGFAVGTGFTAPACGTVSKEKAVRYCGLAIGYLKDASPIIGALGGSSIVALIDKAIPALEKLKAALESNNLPEAGNFFDTVTGILSQIATAVSNLPDSPRKLTVLGIIALVNLTLRVIGSAVEVEAPPASIPANVRAAARPDPIKRAFEASRF